MIRGWLRGNESEVPDWVAVLEAAKEWGCPPWVIENEGSQTWWNRWSVYREETARYHEKMAKQEGGQVSPTIS